MNSRSRSRGKNANVMHEIVIVFRKREGNGRCIATNASRSLFREKLVECFAKSLSNKKYKNEWRGKNAIIGTNDNAVKSADLPATRWSGGEGDRAVDHIAVDSITPQRLVQGPFFWSVCSAI